MINNILYITDLHIRIKNVSEVYELKQAIKKSVNVSMIIIGGDVINKRDTNNKCYDEAEDLIRVCSKVAMTYVLVGNHDYIDQNQYLSDAHWMNHLKNWPNVVIVDRVTSIMCGFQITCVPYVPNGRLVEALNMSKTQWKKSHFVFAHQEIRGCNLGKKISTTGDFWDPSYPTLISGHIHYKQKVNNNVYYPGSTLNQGTQNSVQKILYITPFYTQTGKFGFDMKFCAFKTTVRDIITADTFDSLCYINKTIGNLTNKIFIINIKDARKIAEIRKSQVYVDLVKRAYIVCFAD